MLLGLLTSCVEVPEPVPVKSIPCSAPVIPDPPALHAYPITICEEDGVTCEEWIDIPELDAAALYVWIGDVRRSRQALMTCEHITWIPLEN